MGKPPGQFYTALILHPGPNRRAAVILAAEFG